MNDEESPDDCELDAPPSPETDRISAPAELPEQLYEEPAGQAGSQSSAEHRATEILQQAEARLAELERDMEAFKNLSIEAFNNRARDDHQFHQKLQEDFQGRVTEAVARSEGLLRGEIENARAQATAAASNGLSTRTGWKVIPYKLDDDGNLAEWTVSNGALVEFQDGVHIGAGDLDSWLLSDDDLQYAVVVPGFRKLFYFGPMGGSGRGLIKVRLAKDGDGPHGYGLGNKSHPCEATYTVTSWDGATTYGTGMTPLFQRPPHGKMLAATNGLLDLSETDPTQRLVMCDEVLDDGDC